MDGGNAIFAQHSNGVGIGTLNLAYDRWFHCSSVSERVVSRAIEYSGGSETCQADFGLPKGRNHTRLQSRMPGVNREWPGFEVKFR
jgi:hypothetical protein